MVLKQEKINIPRPYIGVTGLKTVKDVQELSDICLNEGGLFGHPKGSGWGHINHVPMYGFLCSNKRLENPLVGGTQSPPIQDLQTLIRLTPNGAIPMIHYFTTNRDKLTDEIKSLFDGPYSLYESCQALQINMDWPSQFEIQAIRRSFPDMQIVLQIPRKAIGGLDSIAITEETKKYDYLVQYVLIDPSGGEGIEFDLNKCISLFIELSEKICGRNIILGVAGGFDGSNVADRIMKIATNLGHAYFCVDAQGKLRTENKESLDYSLVRGYIGNAAAGIRNADHNTFYQD